MTPHAWFRSISLENVRSFKDRQTINFTDKEGKAARWNVILGDNGTGKTTVLNSLLMSELENQNHPKLYQTLRSKLLTAKIKIEREIFDADNNYHITAIESILEWKNEMNDFIAYSNIVIPYQGKTFNSTIAGYPATRLISELNSLSRFDLFNIFIDGKEELMNAEEWLIQADYLSLKSEIHKNRFSRVKAILLKLFRSEVEDIFITIEGNKPKVLFKTHYGNVHLHELSLGYKTLVGWTVDFASGLLERHPDSHNPLAESAVCLVDEIDLHLHPKFQRTIIPFLTETFPNTQFIVTAHSPLIVIAAEARPMDANVILLTRQGNQTVVINDPVDVTNWSVDQILNSDLFGYTPPRSEPLTELRMERNTLLAKSKMTKKDKLRLTELDASIGFVPFGQNQAEIRAESIIQQLADVLRNQQPMP
jgi:predicted ATP-binding protein involved in virulence